MTARIPGIVTEVSATLVARMMRRLLEVVKARFCSAAGREASGYAREYLAVYLIGTTFSFVSLGMNVYINAQGFATRGMLTVLLGAVANIVLDPLFIFVFRMGVRGAAAATVLSQVLSTAWCFFFLRSSKTPLELSWRTMAPRKKIMGRIMSLGVADFVMGATLILT